MVATSLPFVLDRLELFYHKAHLQNLRADFRDLDEHLASRHEVVRLLAKLPEPSLILGKELEPADESIDQARVRYTKWVNQILMGHLDIIQILFLDLQGKPRFWLELNPRSQQWEPTIHNPDMPSAAFFQNAIKQEIGGVSISKISLDPEAALTDTRRFMTLRLISNIIGHGDNGRMEPIGAVVVNVDVGGMASAYRNTLWVTNDGSYLPERLRGENTPAAFEDFQGLDEIFSEGKLSLWEEGGRQVIWAPLFMTVDSGPLWVGRAVDPSPVSQFRNNLIIRVLTIALIALGILLLSARWIAMNIARFGESLTEQIGRVMRNNEAVRFDWQGPHEIQELGRKLTTLAETHARHAKDQREHARQLEESNRYKSEFLANVSHELRTPLNSILLLSKIMQEGTNQLTEEQKKQLWVIHEAGVDLKELIENILDLSRIEAGQASFSLEEIDVHDLVLGLIELVKPQFDVKGLRLDAEFSDDVPEKFIADLAKVRQILKNFLANALKFTRRGGVTIRAYRQHDAESCPLSIAVIDTGVGIPAEKHQVIFDAFKQADGSTSRLYGGTGLGLSISRELAHLLGGYILLASEEGHGATFTLCLPLETDWTALQVSDHSTSLELPTGGAESLPVAHHQVNAEPDLSDSQSEEFLGKRVLLVDDDLHNLLALTPLLESWGMEVTAAGDGKEALETLADDTDFSIVLMDIMMPEMDGYDTIRVIRNEQKLSGLVIIALSAKTSGEDRDRCIQAGADAFIPKPIDESDLKALIKSYLNV